MVSTAASNVLQIVKTRVSGELRPLLSNYNSQDTLRPGSAPALVWRRGNRPHRQRGLVGGAAGRVDPATPWEADSGGRAGAGNRAAHIHSLRVREGVGGPRDASQVSPAGCFPGSPCAGAGKGVTPAMVAEEGEVAAFLPLAPVSFPPTPSRGPGGTPRAASGRTGPGGGGPWGALGVARGGGARTPR